MQHVRHQSPPLEQSKLTRRPHVWPLFHNPGCQDDVKHFPPVTCTPLKMSRHVFSISAQRSLLQTATRVARSARAEKNCLRMLNKRAF